MRYAIFDTATGRINRIIVAPVGVASATRSCGPGEDFVSAIAGETDASHYVQAFQLIPFPPRPSPYHTFDFATKQWAQDAAECWKWVRAQRAGKLVKADVAINRLEDTGQDATAWRTYRQALRDITQQADPFALVWPAPPVA